MKLLKNIFLLGCLYLYSAIIWAADTTGVQQIDSHASKVQKGIWLTAKWGGIALIVGGFFHAYRNRGQPQALDSIFWVIVSLGGMLFLVGWYMGQSNVSGFAF
jgi:hypothetical protein